MPRTREQVLALYAQYQQGQSLAEIGGREGISHEAVRQLFAAHGLPRRSLADRVADRRAVLQAQAAEQRDLIEQLYKQHGTIEAVLRQVPLPRLVVTEIINQIPNRESYRRRGMQSSYSRQEMIRDLKRAAEHYGEPLTMNGYSAVAKGLGLVAFDTQIRFWSHVDPGNPWSTALKAAKVKGNPPRGKRPNSITPEQCVEAVAQCMREHGGRVSYNTYQRWAQTNLVPSGPTVRKLANRDGTTGWNGVVERALALLA